MTNLGYQSIIRLLLKPQIGEEKDFCEYGSRSLESGLPLNSFDMIGFNFFELIFLIFSLLQEGIPLFAR